MGLIKNFKRDFAQAVNELLPEEDQSAKKDKRKKDKKEKKKKEQSPARPYEGQYNTSADADDLQGETEELAVSDPQENSGVKAENIVSDDRFEQSISANEKATGDIYSGTERTLGGVNEVFDDVEYPIDDGVKESPNVSTAVSEAILKEEAEEAMQKLRRRAEDDGIITDAELDALPDDPAYDYDENLDSDESVTADTLSGSKIADDDELYKYSDSELSEVQEVASIIDEYNPEDYEESEETSEDKSGEVAVEVIKPEKDASDDYAASEEASGVDAGDASVDSDETGISDDISDVEAADISENTEASEEPDNISEESSVNDEESSVEEVSDVETGDASEGTESSEEKNVADRGSVIYIGPNVAIDDENTSEDETIDEEIDKVKSISEGDEDRVAETENEVVENIKEEINDNVSADAPIAAEELAGSITDATTYITSGTTIKGDIETDGSLDLIGTVKGKVTCAGKLIVGGTIRGTVNAGEIYASQAKIRGEVVSEGSIKIGVGSVIEGNVKASSAVIAGAVKGDIDVDGPAIIDSTAIVVGNVKTRSVQVNTGAVIQGFCSQGYAEVDIDNIFTKDEDDSAEVNDSTEAEDNNYNASEKKNNQQKNYNSKNNKRK